MQKTRARCCQVPIRTRRRQSDAKWRASVASCYDTLRFVIPSGKQFPKKKPSKSLILQETEKHIGNLERTVSRLLSCEAQERGQGVLWAKGDYWEPATLEDFQQDFSEQQGNIFQQPSQGGRRCYNMLHDIQEDIIKMKADLNRLAFVPLPSASATPTTTTTNNNNNPSSSGQQPSTTEKECRDATTSTRRHKASKAHKRYYCDPEQSVQRLLNAYQPGDIVNAYVPSKRCVFPSSTATATSITNNHHNNDNLCPPQAVPTTPTYNNSSSLLQQQKHSLSSMTPGPGRSMRLQRMGDGFVCVDHLYNSPAQSLSGLDKMMPHRPSPSQEDLLSSPPIPPSPAQALAQAQTHQHHHHQQQQQKVHVQRQALHEVPALLSPNKMYGISLNDMMMPQQDGEVPDIFAAAAAAASAAASGTASVVGGISPSPTCASSSALNPDVDVNQRMFTKRETDTKPRPIYSSICKKLDFSDPLPDSSSSTNINNMPYLASLVSMTNSGFTPIKNHASPGLSAFIKQELATSPVSGVSIGRSGPNIAFSGINNSNDVSGDSSTSGVGGVGSSGNLSGSHLLMTPVKMSGSDLCMTEAGLFSPSSSWALSSAMDARVPQAGGLSDLEELTEMDDDHGLLCMENLDIDQDFADTLTHQQKTPQKLSSPSPVKRKHSCKKKHHGKAGKHSCSHRPSPQCRKRLAALYEKLVSEVPKNTDIVPQSGDGRQLQSPRRFLEDPDCSEFDGYLLYYQQVSPGLKKQLGDSHDADSLAALVSDMWAKLPQDDRRTMVTLAALENQDSNSSSAGGGRSLSQDLEDLDVTPLHHHHHHHRNNNSTHTLGHLHDDSDGGEDDDDVTRDHKDNIIRLLGSTIDVNAQLQC